MSLDQLLSQLENTTSIAAKSRLVREFARTQASPIIRENRATFFYISEEAREVALEGDWTNWQPTAPMTYLPDTPLWYRNERFPRTARLEYRVVVNGNRRILDPCNPRGTISEFGPHSEVVMPGYRAPREIADETRITRGTIEQHWMISKVLNERRIFWVCLPPRFNAEKKYPVAYLNNGDSYLRYADFPHSMDYLIEWEKVKPFIAVLIKPNEPEKEYARNNQYVRFLVNELVPWVDDIYPTRDEPAARAIIGASLGGLIAAHAAHRRPNVFSLVGSQSGYYSYQKDALLRDYAAAPNLGIRFHLTVGEFENDLYGEGKREHDLVAAQRRFVEVLRAKGHTVASAEYPEGHQWGFWRAHIGEMLRFFWGC